MKAKLSLVAAAALILAGCGGGGGGGSASTPVSPSNPTPPVTIPPVTTPPLPTDPTGLQNTVPAPSFAASSVQLDVFTELNKARAAYGVGQMAENAALNKAATNHALYLTGRLAAGDYADMGHSEDPAKPGFTGRNPAERASFAQYAAATVGGVGENLSSMIAVDGVSSAQGVVAIEALLSAPYHRFGFFDGSREVGIGHGAVRVPGEGGVRNTIVTNFSYGQGTLGQSPANDWIGLWPSDKATGVLYSFAGETPNPIPVNNGACAGYPVSIQVKSGQVLTTTSFVITESTTGVVVRSQLSTAASEVNQAYARANTAYLIPYAPLKLNTNYTVRFIGARDGTAIDKVWTFTTRADNAKLIFGCDPS